MAVNLRLPLAVADLVGSEWGERMRRAVVEMYSPAMERLTGGASELAKRILGVAHQVFEVDERLLRVGGAKIAKECQRARVFKDTKGGGQVGVTYMDVNATVAEFGLKSHKPSSGMGRGYKRTEVVTAMAQLADESDDEEGV